MVSDHVDRQPPTLRKESGQQELPYSLHLLPVHNLSGGDFAPPRWPTPSNHHHHRRRENKAETAMMQAVPLKRSLSRSLIRVIQRALPLVKSRRRSWTTNAKIRMPIDL
ncbi:hypothetical protein B0T21DRAFT_141975 [Apiosordaria backusii]|uniref:Uncharacterized protein n=1 Tax=Apiosordaria backusii TaxID=314023 RepID=A0AA40BS77_9PEZI|nr:hypothetical protein B0T21DRAFT_141975 [Apiosordaria backusii]